MKKLFVAAALAILPTSAFAATADIVTDIARKAISKGYGTECSLEMAPVARGGYFPCIDIGPYRVVFTYKSVKGFVIQKDKPPFLVLGGQADAPSFVVDGPWNADMPARVAMWWNDEVEGGSRKLEETQRASTEKKAAEEYVNKLMGRQEPAPIQQPPAAATPPAPSTAEAPPEEISDDIKQILRQ